MKNLFKLIIAIAGAALIFGCGSVPTVMTVESPDGRIVLTVNTDAGYLMTGSDLAYSVEFDGNKIMKTSPVSMTLADGRVLGGRDAEGAGFTVKKTKRATITEDITAPFYRQASFTETCNELLLECKEGYAIRFRVYDSGIAYRFETKFDGQIEVVNELSSFLFPMDSKAWVPYTHGKDLIANAFQNTYTQENISDFGSGASPYSILPLAVESAGGVKVVICESDLRSYPGMFLTGEDGGYKGFFAQLPDSTYINPVRCQKKVATREDIIARTEGTRTFPWRIAIISDDDRNIPVNNLVYALAEPARYEDLSYVKPGKVAWEWWNDYGLRNVDFTPGVNNDTYKAYIDFASKFGIEYVVLDEGWSAKDDIMVIRDYIDLPGLVAYAAERNVDLVIWAVANVLDDKLEEACAFYKGLGVKGFKIDFIDRDDQDAQDLMYRIADATARHGLMLDIHGVNKPAGLNRTFPNVVNFEGVFGQEEFKWSNPDMPSYDVTFPFLRMVQGPVDYTPGAFVNATKEGFKIDYRHPMSQGTRAHQVATYVVFDSPFTMLCDTPSNYLEDPECTAFIVGIPTVYEQTQILSADLGSHIVSARYAGGKWYVGALTDWNARNITIELPFLEEGKTYKARVLADTEKSDKTPASYAITEVELTAGAKMDLHLAQGGGAAIVIEEK